MKVEEEKEETFVNDWLQRGESFTIKGRLKYIAKFRRTTNSITGKPDVVDVERFDRPEGAYANPWKAVEIDFVFGRNEDDGGRQFRPLMRIVEEPFGGYEICAQQFVPVREGSHRCEIPRTGPKDLLVVLDTLDQYVGSRMHEFCARALVTIRDAGHRNKAKDFFLQYVNMSHRTLDVDTRNYKGPRFHGAQYREGGGVRFDSPPPLTGEYETEEERYREMLKRLDARITSVAREIIKREADDEK
jgi:hypothetical protein